MDMLKIKLMVAEAQKYLKHLDDALDLGDMKAVGAAYYGLEHSLDELSKIVDEAPAPARRGRGRR